MDDVIKKPDVFGGFQALTGSLLSNKPGDKDDDLSVDDDIPVLDSIDDLFNDDADTEPADDKKKKTAKDEPVDDEPVDDDEPTDDDEPASEPKGDKTPAGELTEFEPDITKFFQDKLGSELGWDFEEDEKFESVKELVDYMKDVVETASKPNYANDEIEKLNSFVLNGGKLEDYYKVAKPGGLNVDTLDVTKETDAKMAIREKMAIQGYTEERIKRNLSRYEDNGILEDEGEEAVEFLKEYKTASTEKLLADKEKEASAAKIQQQKFVSTVETNIKGLDAIRGIKISDRDKKDLMDYIFKPDSEGLTKYQRDYMSDVKNLIESAYFTKQGDKLISQAKKTATSDAYKDLHQKLKASKGKRHSGGGSYNDEKSSDSLTSLLGKTLLKQ